jgi:hypothetical protein
MSALETAPPPGEPSISAAIARVAAATQDTIVRRLELLLLDNRDLVSAWILQSALVAVSATVALMAWFAAVGVTVLYATPDAGSIAQLSMFASINTAAAIVLFSYSHSVKPAPVSRDLHVG